MFQLGSFSLTPAKIAGLIGILVICWMILFLVRQFLLNKKNISISEKGMRMSLFQLLRYFLWVLAISGCISVLGFDVTLILAGSAALLVGLGLGLQHIFGDIVSGLLMLLERKIRVGDVMEVDNIVGRVEHISLRTSVLLTRDGYSIIVPNHKFTVDNVINWTHQDFQRRFQIEIGVGYNSDVDLVTQILIQCAMEQKEVLQHEPNAPFVRFNDFGESALVFYLMFWTSDIFRVEQVKSQLRYRILKSFREHKINIPFPQRDIHIIQS